jgi:choline-sulfatase
MPAELTVEAWAADRAVEEIAKEDERPYFGFVSFIGPHPPFAPPVPYNRIYDPDRMLDPVVGDQATDHADEQIPWMNRIIWADTINNAHARVLKARYYGEISYIDACLGRILDAVETRADGDNTLICFFSDHGDHLGDHHAWQKESFFEASCHVPYLVTWPSQLPQNTVRDDLVCLTDLFGIATNAAGATEVRDGIDVLDVVQNSSPQREYITGMYGEPGTPQFKAMIRDKVWKYIYLANGNREQLFNMRTDTDELHNVANENVDVTHMMKSRINGACAVKGAQDALDEGQLRIFPYQERPRGRIYQFDRSRGVTGFPQHPREVLG